MARSKQVVAVLPEAVFTPRAHQINPEMYVGRRSLESRLLRAISSPKNTILRGESGSGKTWLYKKVFSDAAIDFAVINLAAAVNGGSIKQAIEDRLGQLGKHVVTKDETTLTASVRPMGIGVDRIDKKERRIFSKSPFIQLGIELRSRAATKPAVIVFENFEQICNRTDLLQELASLLILVDDDDLAALKVQVLIVAASDDVRSLISKNANANTIANRLLELPEVARLAPEDCKTLFKRGFTDKLHLTFDGDENKILDSLIFKSDRIAQYVHELGLHVARLSIDSGNRISEVTIRHAENEWISESLNSDMAVIEALMNSKGTKLGRKNQVLYALGICDKEDFSIGEIEDLVNETFEKVIGNADSSVRVALAGFSKATNPIIKKTVKGDSYRFISPKYRVCLRVMLELGENGRVAKTHSTGLL